MSAPSPTPSSKQKAPSTNKQNPQSKDESLKKPTPAVNRDRGKNDKNVWVSRTQNGKGSGSVQDTNDNHQQNTDNVDKTLEQQVKDMSIQDPSKSDSAKKQQIATKQGNRKSQEIQPQQIQSQKQQRSPPQKRKQNSQQTQATQSASAEKDSHPEEHEQDHDSEKKSSKGVGKVKLSLAEFHSTVPTKPEDETPNRVLWVGNLSPDTASKDIEIHFSPFGAIENIRILPHKHCAFVNFEDEKQAREAKKQLNGTQLKNTTIVVNYRKSEPKQNTQQPSHGNNSYNDNSTGRNDDYPTPGLANSPPVLSPSMSYEDGQSNVILNTPSRALWIGNVSNDITEDDLYQEFAQFGDIESIRMLRAKTCAFVNFYTEESALKALHTMQGKVLANMPIKLNFGKLPSRTSKRQSQMDYPMPPMGMPPGYMMGQYIPPEYYSMPYGMPPQVPFMPMDPYQMYYPQIHICEMCATNPKEAFWAPCGHAGCHECVVKLQQEQSQNPEKGPLKCPYCQTPIQKFMEITFAPAYVPYAPQPQPPMQPQSPTIPSRAPANAAPAPVSHGNFPAQ